MAEFDASRPDLVTRVFRFDGDGLVFLKTRSIYRVKLWRGGGTDLNKLGQFLGGFRNQLRASDTFWFLLVVHGSNLRRSLINLLSYKAGCSPALPMAYIHATKTWGSDERSLEDGTQVKYLDSYTNRRDLVVKNRFLPIHQKVALFGECKLCWTVLAIGHYERDTLQDIAGGDYNPFAVGALRNE